MPLSRSPGRLSSVHHEADADLRPNLSSEDRRCGVLRFSCPKIEDGGFFDLRGRRTKMGGSSIFSSEERRWVGSSFFGAGRSKTRPHLRRTPHLEEPLSIFEEPLHLRRARPSSKKPLSSKSPIFDLRSRRSKNAPILNLRLSAPKTEEPSIFDLRPRRMVRRSDGRRGRGCDLFEDGVISKMGVLRFSGSEERGIPYFRFSNPEERRTPSHLVFSRTEERRTPFLRHLPSLGFLRVDLETDLPARGLVRRLRSASSLLPRFLEAKMDRCILGAPTRRCVTQPRPDPTRCSSPRPARTGGPAAARRRVPTHPARRMYRVLDSTGFVLLLSANTQIEKTTFSKR